MGDVYTQVRAIRITLIANAGILVEYNGIGFLVDGIHTADDPPFSRVPEADLAAMRQGVPPFTHLDYLLFSHEHGDHCSPPAVLAHIYARPVQGIFLPDTAHGSQELARLRRHILRLGIPHWSLGLAPGTSRRIVLTDHVQVTVIGTRHMGPQYQEVRNDCFLLELDGRTLLFTGDGDHVWDYYAPALSGKQLDAVFVNPLFYHHKKGQRILRELFHPRHVLIYHLPFPEDETLRLTAMVYRDRERFASPATQVHILNQPHQSLLLPVPAAQPVVS